MEHLGFVVNRTGEFGSVAILVHEFSEEVFSELIRELMDIQQLKGQHDEWLPGNPTKDPEDLGFYLCPINPEEWELGDFDMLIQTDIVWVC